MAGAGTGNTPCAERTMPPPTFSGDADDPVGAEPLEPEHRADDVDDRVERADLVQVHLLDRHLVDRRLGLREPAEQADGARAGAAGQRRPFDQRGDLCEGPVRVAGVPVGLVVSLPRPVGRFRFVVVMDMVVAIVPVGVLMPMRRGLAGGGVRRLVLALDQPELRGRQPRPQHTIGREAVAGDHQAAERRFELVERQADVEQGAEHHVARRAREAVEVENSRHRFSDGRAEALPVRSSRIP